LELLSLPFNVLATFLEEAIKVMGARRRERESNFSSPRQVQSAFARVMTCLRDECLGGRARRSVRFPSDRAMDSPEGHHDVDAEWTVAAREPLESDPVLGDALAGLQAAQLCACEFEKRLGHGTLLERNLIV